MGHAHAHSVTHFRWCTHPDSCYCEVNRYLLAGFWGVFAAMAGWLISMRGGTYGGETNALHDFSDGGFILLSALLATFKHRYENRAQGIDDFGMWVNNLSFIVIGAYMIHKMVHAGDTKFIGEMMFLAGLVAFIGNVVQFWLLGEHIGSASDMHHSNRVHVLFDMMNSWAVMYGASLALIMAVEDFLVLKITSTFSLGLIGALIAIRFVGYKDWTRGRRFDFWVGYVLLSAYMSMLVVSGTPRDMDLFIGVVLSFVMIVGGLRNIWRRYVPKKGKLSQ
jgi:hypothetical protein